MLNKKTRLRFLKNLYINFRASAGEFDMIVIGKELEIDV